MKSVWGLCLPKVGFLFILCYPKKLLKQNVYISVIESQVMCKNIVLGLYMLWWFWGISFVYQNVKLVTLIFNEF